MEHKTLFKNKSGINAVATHSDTKRNIPGVLSFASTVLYSTYSINKRSDQSRLWISSTQNWEKISDLLYMDDLKLLGRIEDDLEHEIKIVKQLAKTLVWILD